MLAISITIDETNLLRRFHPAPQSDEQVVRCILVFVMPLAVLMHLGAARVLFTQLRAPSDRADGAAPALADYLLPPLTFGSQSDDGLALVAWSIWINAPPTIYFILRQWSAWWRGGATVRSRAASASASRKPSEVASAAGAGNGQVGSVRMLVGRAIAGSVHNPWTRLEADGESNEALALSYLDLQRIYRKAGRECELAYAPLDTSALWQAPAASRVD